MHSVFSSILAAATLEAGEPRLGGTQGPDLTRYFVVCAVLLLAVALLALGFRKWVGRALATRAAQRSLAVIDVLPLSNKHKLAVVRCYDRTFLLGLGEREMSLVSELDRVIEPQKPTLPTRADARGFASVLERLRRQPPAKSSSAADGFVA